AEVLAPLGLPCKQFMLGIQDCFGRSGKPTDLLDYYKLDAKHIASYVQEKVL
ncbi:MAG: transketolase family protein, partial [Erysipelotrichia bacterium]|nr:transketolase family protein [Erysipelotrichia bacterium]